MNAARIIANTGKQQSLLLRTRRFLRVMIRDRFSALDRYAERAQVAGKSDAPTKMHVRSTECCNVNVIIRLHFTRLFPDPRFLLFELQNIAGYKNAVECLLQ